MKFNFVFILFFLTILTKNVSFSNNLLNSYPPDTTTKLTDKAAAMLLVDEGRTVYDEDRFKEALNLFREAAAKDPNSWKPLFWISQCHFHLNNYGYALKYAREAYYMDKNEVDKDVIATIANCYHQMNQIDSALTYYDLSLKQLSKSRIVDLAIEHKISECNFAKDQLNKGLKPLRVKIEDEISTGFNDYAPVLSNDGKTLYFTSRRSNTTGGHTNDADQEFLEDIYRAKWDETEQKWDSVTNEIDRINTKGHDALSYLSPDGLHAIVTLNTTMLEDKRATHSGEIAEIHFTDKGKWSTPKIIKNTTINSNYGESGATITADGNTMVFMSDRNYDKTARDLYIVQKVGKAWGEAVRLPDSINTKGNETTPFITADGRYLFFSSDGHPGMGGFDVFVCENLGENKWSQPKNLGIIINSVNDDTHFQYYPQLKKALFSSIEIAGQKSSRDIFEVDMTNWEFPKFY